MLLAHVGHWAVNLLYALPVLIIGGGLGWQAYKDRRDGVTPGEDPAPAAAGPTPAPPSSER